jgi:hypothetical protein
LNDDNVTQKHIHGLKHEQLIQLMREGEQTANGVVRPSLSTPRPLILSGPEVISDAIEVVTSDAEQAPFAGTFKRSESRNGTATLRSQYAQSNGRKHDQTNRYVITSDQVGI